MKRSWYAAVTVGLASCTVDLTVQGEPEIRCDSSVECPESFICDGEVGFCVREDSAAVPLPEPAVVFHTPVRDAQGVSPSTTFLLVFDRPLLPGTLEGRVHLVDEASVSQDLAVATEEGQSTFELTSPARLRGDTSYTVRVDAGVNPAIGIPSRDPFEYSFVTGPSSLVEPPGPPTSILFEELSSLTARVSWEEPSDVDYAGTLVLRRAAGLSGDPMLEAARAYAQGDSLANGWSVIGVAGTPVWLDPDTTGGPYEYGLVAFDEERFYAPLAPVPSASGVRAWWCPAGPGNFGVTAAEAGATMQLVLNTAQGATIEDGTLVPPTPVPAAAQLALDPSSVPPDTTVYVRVLVDSAAGRYAGPETTWRTNTGILPVLHQPLPVGEGGVAVLRLNGTGWPEFESEVDTDAASGTETWVTGGTGGGVVSVSHTPGIAGFFRIRVRPVVNGCAGAAWTESDEFESGRFIFLRPGAAGASTGLDAENPSSDVTLLNSAPADTQVFLAGGSLLGPVTLTTPLTVRGGYANDFLSRDTSTIDSEITSAAASTTLSVAVTGAVTLDGLRVSNTAVDTNVTALEVSSGTVDLVDVRVDTGSSSDTSRGLHVSSGATAALTGGNYDGGQATSRSIAIHCEGGAVCMVTGTDASGGTSSDLAYGILAENAELNVSGASIVGGVGDRNRGIACVDCVATIVDNSIEGGTASAAGPTAIIGIDVRGSSTATIAGNQVVTSSIFQPKSIWVEDGTVVSRNNVLFGFLWLQSGSTVTMTHDVVIKPPQSAGDHVSIRESNPSISNTLFVCPTGSGLLREEQDDADPRSFLNNHIAGCAYFNESAAQLFTSGDVNGLDGLAIDELPMGCSPPACETSRYAANSFGSFTLEELFVDWDGPDDDVRTLTDNDWHLLTSDAGLLFGGLDSTVAVCGSYENPESCGDVASDAEGTARTCPTPVSDCTSLGPFEKDTP